MVPGQVEAERANAVLGGRGEDALALQRVLRALVEVPAEGRPHPEHGRDRWGERVLRTGQLVRLLVQPPVEVEPRVLGGLGGLPRHGRDAHEGEPGRGAESLLRTTHRHVDAPRVAVVRDGAQAADDVDRKEHAGVPRHLRHRLHVVDHARRGLALLHEHALRRHSVQRGLHVRRLDGPAPLVVDRLDVEPVGSGDPGEALPEEPGDGHHDVVPGREEVRHSRLEPAGSARGEDQDVVLRLEDRLQGFGDLAQELAVPRPSVIDERAPLSQQDLRRDRCRPRGHDDLGLLHLRVTPAGESEGRVRPARPA